MVERALNGIVKRALGGVCVAKQYYRCCSSRCVHEVTARPIGVMPKEWEPLIANFDDRSHDDCDLIVVSLLVVEEQQMIHGWGSGVEVFEGEDGAVEGACKLGGFKCVSSLHDDGARVSATVNESDAVGCHFVSLWRW